ncbi:MULTISPECIES: carboxypeptidase M32 [unclassified Vibrio]|uniref:Metal-dependent carboxypeptidase n=1 Tax=Vibrio sp. HB236076 TaxID=3232307 RepID=A0AB39HFQ2_9VIBR|nr:carboxypeptidase M32 [Vibrio sp. HB161653]MDP5254958.1 carboxypeptidase M32 [Vibrio sp. HB161653]
MSSYQALEKHFDTIHQYQHMAAILGWDQATMMASGGQESRAQAMAQLSVHIHQLYTAPQLTDWIEAAKEQPLTDHQFANLREIERQVLQHSVLPEKLVKAKSLAGAKCEHAWRQQRPRNDWPGFEKNWAQVVSLSQEEAQIRSQHHQLTPYEAMLDLYEPGMSEQKLDKIFGQTLTWLPNLIDQVIETQPSVSPPSGQYGTHQQKGLGLEIMKLMQFDFERGRLDESVHPFCGGVPSDTRITTRYTNNDFAQSLMGIIHETGHARYEQNLPKDWSAQPAGQARSMGIHESQSLFFEMQLGRHPLFLQHVSQHAKRFFDGPEFEPHALAALYNKVEKSLIRVDADELTYPCHVILRYEIERDLINGKLSHRDVPEIWNSKMQTYLGLSTLGKDNNGCMQDIHWTDGSFGYFPSYTLGAMYAAQFMASMKETIDVDSAIQTGDLSPIFNWLNNNIWSKGSLLTTDDLVKQATDMTLDPIHFQNHLRNRYLGKC